jgi:hydroxylysine kinase
MVLRLSPELEDAPPTVTATQARDLASELFGLDVSHLRPLSAERDRNFHVRDVQNREFALKVIHPAEDPAVTDFQTRALQHVAEVDPTLPTPRVLRCVKTGAGHAVWETPDGPPRLVRCVSYLPGQQLFATPRTTAQRRNIGTVLARLDRALAAFRHPAEDHQLLWDLKRAERARELLVAIPERRQRALPERALARFAEEIKPRIQSMRFQTVHNDFNPHNVLMFARSPDHVAGVIDFGDMVRGPLVQDVATASAYQIPPDGHPLWGVVDVVSAFHAVYPLTEAEISVIPDLIATRLSLAIAIASWRAVQQPDNASYITRNTSTAWANLDRLLELTSDDAISWLLDRAPVS